MGPDGVQKFSDDRYRVTSGMSTSLAGDVGFEHVITLQSGDRYDDALTVIFHARTHPVKYLFTGSGHWIAPCPPATQ